MAAAEIVQPGIGGHGHLLEGVAGVFADPFAIRMIVRQRRHALRRQAAADFGITQRARRQRDLQFEQIAGHADVQHPAGIGHRGRVFGCRLDIGRRQAPALAQAQMQVHFDIDNRAQAQIGGTHIGQRAALVRGQRVGAGELDQEQVVLHQIALERRQRQAAIAEAAHEGVVDVGIPVIRRSGLQSGKQGHVDRLRQPQAASGKGKGRRGFRRGGAGTDGRPPEIVGQRAGKVHVGVDGGGCGRE